MQAARLPLQSKSATCGLQFVRRGKAEREREGSAARLIQRTKMRRVGRCRATAARQRATDTRWTRSPERENSRRRICRHAPNFLSLRERQRARLCSTALARIVPFVFQVLNERGIQFVPCRFPVPPLRMHNDSRPRSMSRSRSQQLRSAWSRSHCVQSSNHGQFSNLFL